jgi:hypothetical protein
MTSMKRDSEKLNDFNRNKHATICRVRFVFWRIKMSAGAIIHSCNHLTRVYSMDHSPINQNFELNKLDKNFITA